MQRLVFEGGGRRVRLSANSCQLHRPNTIPIFCAAVCRDYRLRTYIDIALKFLLCGISFCEVFLYRLQIMHQNIPAGADLIAFIDLIVGEALAAPVLHPFPEGFQIMKWDIIQFI